MAVEITVPSVGESVTEGTLSRWLKKEGDTVRAGDPVFELETEKATTEVAAPADGALKITVPEGQTVTVGSVVGRIEPGEQKAGARQPPPEKPARAPAPATEPVPNREPAPAERPAAPQGDHHAEAPLSPAARRLAEEEGVDVRALAGSGRGGRITKEDVLTHLQRQGQQEGEPQTRHAGDMARETGTALAPAQSLPPAPAREMPREPAAAGNRETRQRMSAIRQRIADRLVAAQQNAAILTTFNEADLSAIMALRARYKESFQQKHGVGLGFMSFFVKACVEALRAYPVVNARIDGSDIVYQHFYDIGVAVSTEKGLMVPVLRSADRLPFAEVEKQIAEMARKAREGKIGVADLQGGTFTITNGGVFGSLLSTPILNPPQSAILGMHTIQKRPVAVNDRVVIRPMMYLAVSYDHRLIDGREAVQFLVRVKECVENPERLLLEV